LAILIDVKFVDLKIQNSCGTLFRKRMKSMESGTEKAKQLIVVVVAIVVVQIAVVASVVVVVAIAVELRNYFHKVSHVKIALLFAIKHGLFKSKRTIY
jgi:hypothetical protein